MGKTKRKHEAGGSRSGEAAPLAKGKLTWRSVQVIWFITPMEPRFEIISLWRFYFSHSLEWSLGKLNAWKIPKTRALVHTLAGYKSPIWQISVAMRTWNFSPDLKYSPMKMLCLTLIGHPWGKKSFTNKNLYRCGLRYDAVNIPLCRQRFKTGTKR